MPTIKTKYGIGDLVWVMHFNIPKEGRISRVETDQHFNDKLPHVRYLLSEPDKKYTFFMDGSGSNKWFKEVVVYKTKALLLKSL
jgi:hypothetical protein